MNSGPFISFFEHYYPTADAHVRATAMIAWNAAVHECAHLVEKNTDVEVDAQRYERAALLRDVREEIETKLIASNG
jgi:hypothetical protein